ncbi:MAG: AcvB/VirJ family lysyl-phosphatidylglycerol hydrolase [Ginsengibacter sp.]
MKYLPFLIFIFLGLPVSNPVHAQIKENIADLPVIFIPAKKKSGETMVFFITGDGGWNAFSQKLGDQYASSGIPVVALNSLKYFWKKRTPEETAQAVSDLLYQYSREWGKKNILLCGYSFGADVMPFIFTRMPVDLKEKISSIQLLSPSPYTDFEVHVSYLFMSKKFDVASEVQKINKPIVCYYGAEEEKPLQSIAMNNFKLIILKGNHHYEDSFGEIVGTRLSAR